LNRGVEVGFVALAKLLGLGYLLLLVFQKASVLKVTQEAEESRYTGNRSEKPVGVLVRPLDAVDCDLLALVKITHVAREVCYGRCWILGWRWRVSLAKQKNGKRQSASGRRR